MKKEICSLMFEYCDSVCVYYFPEYNKTIKLLHLYSIKLDGPHIA